jgi:hypothetical protein
VQLWNRHGLAPHPLSPTRWLPPSPRRIESRHRDGEVALVILYPVMYLLKLVQTGSSVRAWLANLNGTDPEL